jgi:hypothetical protein
MVFIALVDVANLNQENTQICNTENGAKNWIAEKLSQMFDAKYKSASRADNRFKLHYIDLEGDEVKIKKDFRSNFEVLVTEMTNEFFPDLKQAIIEKKKEGASEFLEKMIKAKEEKKANCKCVKCNWCADKKNRRRKPTKEELKENLLNYANEVKAKAGRPLKPKKAKGKREEMKKDPKVAFDGTKA